MPCPTHRCIGLKYLAQTTSDTELSLLPVSWMSCSSGKALSYLIRESPEMKLVMLKGIAAVLVNGLGTENKPVVIKR
jgi:hypothetical protein